MMAMNTFENRNMHYTPEDKLLEMDVQPNAGMRITMSLLKDDAEFFTVAKELHNAVCADSCRNAVYNGDIRVLVLRVNAAPVCCARVRRDGDGYVLTRVVGDYNNCIPAGRNYSPKTLLVNWAETRGVRIPTQTLCSMIQMRSET